MHAYRILILDDDPGVCEFLRMAVAECGFDAKVPDDYRSFASSYHEYEPGVVLTDLHMPGMDGVEVLRFLAEQHPAPAVILLSGFDAKVLSTAQRLGASLGLDILGVLHKPVSLSDLESVLRRAVRHVGAASESTRADGFGGEPLSVTELEAALEEGRLCVHYQPKVALLNEERRPVTGVEALVRCRHPGGDLIPPSAFVPVAEESALIARLTDVVLDLAMAQLQGWRAAAGDLTLALNISPRLLGDLTLPDRLAERAVHYGIAPESVVLEMTESGVMGDPAQTMDILTRFRLKGFELSIDDFATGYSSLVQLYRMPFTELKIDKSFVIESDASEEARVIVRTVVDLAHNLGLRVCAEGVETRTSEGFLASLGCEEAQGYYFARPLAAEAFPPWLESWSQRRQVSA